MSTDGRIIQLGVEPRRIDLINRIEAVQFSEAWENRKELTFESVIINIISVEDLIKNKEATGRMQDLADVEILRQINS